MTSVSTYLEYLLFLAVACTVPLKRQGYLGWWVCVSESSPLWLAKSLQPSGGASLHRRSSWADWPLGIRIGFLLSVL